MTAIPLQPPRYRATIDHRAVSWVIHQNDKSLKHTTDAKEADEAIRVGFRVENQYATADAMTVARSVRDACRTSIDNPMNHANLNAIRKSVDSIDLALVVGTALQVKPWKRPLMSLTGYQLAYLLPMAWPDMATDHDQGDSALTFWRRDEAEVIDGEDCAPGLYFYWEDCPDEGSVHISDEAPALLAPLGGEGGHDTIADYLKRGALSAPVPHPSVADHVSRAQIEALWVEGADQ
jgi:hypothetical protein